MNKKRIIMLNGVVANDKKGIIFLYLWGMRKYAKFMLDEKLKL